METGMCQVKGSRCSDNLRVFKWSFGLPTLRQSVQPARTFQNQQMQYYIEHIQCTWGPEFTKYKPSFSMTPNQQLLHCKYEQAAKRHCNWDIMLLKVINNKIGSHAYLGPALRGRWCASTMLDDKEENVRGWTAIQFPKWKKWLIL